MKIGSLIVIALVLLLGSALQGLQAQTAVPAAGGNAAGSGGTVSFTVGQVFYIMSTGTTGSVLQGVQQPREISEPEGKSQILTFKTGWNLFSFNTLPGNPDMKVIFQSLIDAGKLVKVQDENGVALEDFGIFGGWTNNIGEVSLTEGYKAKVTQACQLTVTGSGISLPFGIPLKTGWNIAGFPYDTEVDGMTIVQQLIDRHTLIKVQDELGNAIEDFGIFGGWTNNLGNFMPGKGYKMKLNATDNLVIQASYAKAGHIVRQEAPVVHFRAVTEGNGVDHMNINLVGLKEGVWHPGDEIGVFDGNLCVGAVTLLPGHIESRVVAVTASAEDGMGGAGFTDGRSFTLRLWKQDSGKEYLIEPEIIRGTANFAKHESTLANVGKYIPEGIPIPGNSGKISCYPNPTHGEVHLRIDDLPAEGVRVEVMNALGQTVLSRVISTETVTIDLSGHVSGVYYIRLSNHQWYETERIILK